MYLLLQVMEKLPQAQAAMIEYFTTRTEEATLGLAILPGVRELLTRLKVGAVTFVLHCLWSVPQM